MHRIFLSSALVLFMVCAAFAQDIAGDWLGTFKIGSQDFHMILHITKGNGGGLTAKLDVIENNANDIPVSSISIQDSKLSFVVDTSNLHAKYEGKVDVNATSIQGTWSEPSKAFPMDFKRQADTGPAITRAGQILDLVFQDKYADLLVTASSQLRTSAGLTEDKLRAEIRKILSPMGAVRKRLDAKAYPEGDLQVVVVPVQFEKGTVDFTIMLNSSREVDHLFLRPGEPAKFELAADEQEVTFKFGEDTFYGTLLIPQNAKGKVPGVLLLSGSGPTDRDGNSRLLPGKIDSQKYFARILADAGVASLRYDKYGTGKTGIGSYGNKLASMTFDAFVDLALAAYQYLGSRPEIDPAHLAILGHSEGGFIAMVAADRLKTATPPVALILAASLPKLYMTTLRDQIAEQYANAVKAGVFTQQQANDGMAELDRIIAQVNKDATVPEKMSPQFTSLFAPENLKFLQNVNQYDPQKLAANLPAKIGVLVLCGRKDVQVPCDSEKLLADAFKQGGNKGMQFVELTNVNHVFKEVEGVPNPATDYTDPAKPFSREAGRVITEFIKAIIFP
jgi:hypothetical protein